MVLLTCCRSCAVDLQINRPALNPYFLRYLQGVSASQGVRCAVVRRSVCPSRGVVFEIERASVSASELLPFAMSRGGVLHVA